MKELEVKELKPRGLPPKMDTKELQGLGFATAIFISHMPKLAALGGRGCGKLEKVAVHDSV